MRRLLILTHRYLGIPLSLMFVVWFISGIVMIYTGGFPTITETQRLARLAPLDLDDVRISPSAALNAAGMFGGASAVTLKTVMNRPAYRFTSYFGGAQIVFADNGEALSSLTPEDAASVAGSYLDVAPEQITFTETLEFPDQWTLLQRNDLPLHKFSVDDPRRTRVYVSPTTGEVELITTRTSRFFAWIGVIPHWLYFESFRANQSLWLRTIVVISAFGCLLAVFGLALAYTQFRRSRPFKLSKSVRYRGWMRWHYFSGAIFGVFALTWAFSGMMSVEPFSWSSEGFIDVPQEALSGYDLDLQPFPVIGSATSVSRALEQYMPAEVEFRQMLGEPYFVVTPAGAANSMHDRPALHAVSLTPRAVGDDALVRAIQEAVPDYSVTGVTRIDDYDSYYYTQDADRPLPVLRIKFDDPGETWYYIDPEEARLVFRTNRNRRVQRWMFNGLHSLDFSFWHQRRPLWDIGMIALSLGALLTSAIGLYLGARRLLGLRR